MSYYATDGSNAVEQIDLAVGDRLRLDWDAANWWPVQAVSPNFAACVRPLTDDDILAADGEGVATDDDTAVLYTVLDWRNGVRGPCDLVGQGWGDGTYSAQECAEMLAAFEAGEVQVSQRNWARLAVLEHQRAAQRVAST